MQNKEDKHHEPMLIGDRHTFNPMAVYESIRDCFDGDDAHQSELDVEEIHLLSRSKYTSLDVDVEAVKAILASDDTLPKYYSYLALCKDPLVPIESSCIGLEIMRCEKNLFSEFSKV